MIAVMLKVLPSWVEVPIAWAWMWIDLGSLFWAKLEFPPVKSVAAAIRIVMPVRKTILDFLMFILLFVTEPRLLAIASSLCTAIVLRRTRRVGPLPNTRWQVG